MGILLFPEHLTRPKHWTSEKCDLKRRAVGNPISIRRHHSHLRRSSWTIQIPRLDQFFSIISFNPNVHGQDHNFSDEITVLVANIIPWFSFTRSCFTQQFRSSKQQLFADETTTFPGQKNLPMFVR
jgi:hypothetical protein